MFQKKKHVFFLKNYSFTKSSFPILKMFFKFVHFQNSKGLGLLSFILNLIKVQEHFQVCKLYLFVN